LTACWHCAKIPKAKPIFPCNIGFVKRKRACAERLLQGLAQNMKTITEFGLPLGKFFIFISAFRRITGKVW
jgi:hypothetical protein